MCLSAMRPMVQLGARSSNMHTWASTIMISIDTTRISRTTYSWWWRPMNGINSYIMHQLCSWNIGTFARQMENISLSALTDNWSCNRILDQANVIKQKLITTNLWKHQDMAQDFQALLASKHGSKLIRSLMNNFMVKTSPHPQKDQNPIPDKWKFPPWQLIVQPSNLNTPIPHAGKDYWFCTKCNPPHLVHHKDLEHKTGLKWTSPMTL